MAGDERMFPVQRERGAAPHPTRIPWSVADRAYSVYSARYGRDQSLERLAERGGFAPSEMDEFLPGWRDEASEVARLMAEVERLTAALPPDPAPGMAEIGRLVDEYGEMTRAEGCCGGPPKCDQGPQHATATRATRAALLAAIRAFAAPGPDRYAGGLEAAAREVERSAEFTIYRREWIEVARRVRSLPVPEPAPAAPPTAPARATTGGGGTVCGTCGGDGTALCHAATDVDARILRCRARYYAAEKFLSRLLGIGLNQAVDEAERRLNHPRGVAIHWDGTRQDWDRINITILEGALSRLRLQAAHQGPDCICAECRGVAVDLCPPSQPEATACPECGGRGWTPGEAVATGYDKSGDPYPYPYPTQEPCEACDGTGRAPADGGGRP